MRATLGACCITVAMLSSQPGWATVFQNYQAIDSFTDSTPRAVTSADFNNDGNADLAVTGSDTDQLAVLSGNGDGSFDDAVLYNSGGNPYSVAHAILSGGGVDLVTANRDSNNISIFLNDGSSNFSATTKSTGNAPVFVLTAQLEGADVDLVTANSGSDSISVFLNNGDGTFAAKTDYSTSLSSPAAVAAADMDGDSDLDLAVINQGDNSIAVFINNGSGVFSFSASYATGATPHAVAAGDLNGDNFAELVVSNSDSDTVSIFFNNLDGSFATKQDHATGSTPHGIIVEDLDEDNDLDIAVANNASDTISVFENSGTHSGTFDTRRDVSSVKGPSGLDAQDLDDDQYAELIVTNLLSFNFAYLQNLAPVTPDQFSLDPVTDAALATDKQSDPVTISGLAAPAPISIDAAIQVDPVSGSESYDASYSINDGPFKATAGTINDGDTVQVQVRSASREGETVTKTLTIGGLDVTFSVTTRGDDTPNTFSIIPRVGVEPGETVISAPVTITGLGAPATIAISNGEYRINGGTFTSNSGTIDNRDELEIRLTAASTYGSQTGAPISIGGVQGTFIVITKDAPSSSGGGGGGNLSPLATLLLGALGWRRQRRAGATMR